MNKEQQELVGDAFMRYYNSFPTPGKLYEYAERWGLKIEERELSLEERAKWLQDNKGWDLLVGNLDHDHIREVVEKEAPTKLITITHNDKTIESYE